MPNIMVALKSTVLMLFACPLLVVNPTTQAIGKIKQGKVICKVFVKYKYL